MSTYIYIYAYVYIYMALKGSEHTYQVSLNLQEMRAIQLMFDLALGYFPRVHFVLLLGL